MQHFNWQLLATPVSVQVTPSYIFLLCWISWHL